MRLKSLSDPTRLRRLALVMRFATLGLIVAMFLGTHLPNALPPGLATSDKTIHFWAYLSLSFFLITTCDLSVERLRPIHYFVIALACSLYGAIDEITQIPVGRTCDSVDWLFDVLGVVSGLLLFRVLRPLIHKIVLSIPMISRASQ